MDKNIPLWDFRFPHKDAIAFEIICIEESPLPKHVDFSKPSRVTFYEILWITAGIGTRYIDFEGYPVQPNTVFCLTPGQVHFWDVQEPVERSPTGYVILFTEEFPISTSLDRGFLRSLDFFHGIDHAPVFYLDDAEACLAFLEVEVEHLAFKSLGRFCCPGKMVDYPTPEWYHGDIRDRPNEQDLQRAEEFVEEILLAIK